MIIPCVFLYKQSVSRRQHPLSRFLSITVDHHRPELHLFLKNLAFKTDSLMESSLPMEYLQGLLRLALHQSQSVDQQLGDIGPSVKSDPFSRSSNFKLTSKTVSALPLPSHVVDTDTEININEERLITRFDTILDNKLRDFQERFIEPLAIGILRIEKQCSQFEARMLLNPGLTKQPPNDTALPPLRPSMPGSYRPSRSSGSSVASFCEDVLESLTMDSKNQASTKTMQMVANLLAQIGKDGLSSDIHTITLGDKVASTRETSTSASHRNKPSVMDDKASDWSDSVFGGDWKEVKPCSKSSSTRPIPGTNNKGARYVMPEEKKVGETLVVVDDLNGVAVRSLDPRPCHRYVSRSPVTGSKSLMLLTIHPPDITFVC